MLFIELPFLTVDGRAFMPDQAGTEDLHYLSLVLFSVAAPFTLGQSNNTKGPGKGFRRLRFIQVPFKHIRRKTPKTGT
jgi:hypothetical protein